MNLMPKEPQGQRKASRRVVREMTTIFDVALLVTKMVGEVTAMKLQKLLYYCQAWNLVWEESPLFEDDFQAWANGPVLPALYSRHRGQFKVSEANFADGNIGHISSVQEENIKRVIDFYGDKTAQWLSELTHQEAPWLDARGATPIGERSEAIISKSAIYEYYSSL